MKIALVYHGVLRWPEGIFTQLDQLKYHDVDLFFCLQKDSDTMNIINRFDFKKINLYTRPTFDYFNSCLDMNCLKSIENNNWLSYSPFYGKGFSLLNYHNFYKIKQSFEKDFKEYDLVVISRSDLRAMFPFDFSNFNDQTLFLSREFRAGGIQMIGSWFYGSPKMICKALNSLFSLIRDNPEILKKSKPKHWNVEGYSKICLDFYNISYDFFSLNCFISADNLLSESSGYGFLKFDNKKGYIYKYLDQYRSCLNNHNKHKS